MKAYPNLLEAVAITVESLRKERKLTKTALASFAELQDCYIRGITKGQRNPTIATIYSICDALGISSVDFFQRVEIEMNRLASKNEDRGAKDS